MIDHPGEARVDAGLALEMRGVTRRFGSTLALDHADFVVRRGSVHALLGENGAGKSTLMRIAFGMLGADSGTVRRFGIAARSQSVRESMGAGVGMVHQHLSLAPSLSALENLVLGQRGLFRRRESEQLFERAATSAGFRVQPDTLVRDLSVVEQQRLEILKALAWGARLLILDEPTAVLAPAEADALMRWVRDFAQKGGSVVLVTHKLGEAMSVADDVTVLRRGEVAVTSPIRKATADALAAAIFPDVSAPEVAALTAPAGDIVVVARDLVALDDRGARRLGPAQFELRRGEIVGVAAVEGSGHRELLDVLSGARAPSAGTVQLPARIAVIPVNRGEQGLIAEFTLTENVALRGAGARRGLMPWRDLGLRTRAMMDRFDVKAPAPSVRAATLSGGNQQRMVVARELADPVDLVVADNPTRGLDIRASAFVHEQLRAAAVRGAAVVVHASDLDDVLDVATRMLVVFDGQVREVPMDRDAIGRAMIGAA